MIDKKFHDEEAQEPEKIYNHYLDKRKQIMNSTKFKVEDVFGNVIPTDSISTEQITKSDNFFGGNDVNININIKFSFLNLGRKILFINRVLLPKFQIFNK